MKEKPLPPGEYGNQALHPVLNSSNIVDVEQDPKSKRVRCLICKEFDPLRQGEWIKKTSLKKHLDSDRHKENLVLTSERREHEQMEARRLEAAYNSNPAVLPEIDNDVPYNIRSGLFDQPVNNTNTIPNDPALYSGIYQEPLIPTFIPLISNNTDERKAILQSQIEMLLRQAEQNDEFGQGADEDLTFTNTEDTFGNIYLYTL